MTTLDSDFETAVEQVVLDVAERHLRDRLDDTVAESHRVLREYGGRNDYSVEPVIDSLQSPTIRRESDRVVARWGWTHEAAPFFDAGVSPHTIEGDPILRFVWEDAPAGVREMFADTERVDGDPVVYFDSVEHPGIPASRFVRAGVDWLRTHL